MDTRVVVPNNQQSCIDGSSRRIFKYGYVPLKQLENIDPQSYESVVKLFKPLGNNFYGNFIEKDWSSSGTYIQNVVTFRDDKERDNLHRYLLEHGNAFGRDMFGFSFDDDHVHVLHSCAFSSSQCKCKWRKNLPCGKIKPGYRFRSNFREWGRGNFLNAVLYFFYKKGGRKEAWIEGRRQRLEDNLECVQWEEVERELGRILAISNTQTGLDLRPGNSDGEFDEPVNKSRKRRYGWEKGEENKGTKQSKWQIIQGKIQQLLESTAICPLESIKSEDCFLKDDWLTDPMNANYVKSAIELWSHKINNWTLREFYDMYKEQNYSNLIFSRSKLYFPTMEESFDAINDLLKFQYNDDEGLIKQFLQSLVNVVDRQPHINPDSNTKTNTFLVYSPPSGGKNFFFDMLFTLLLNMGQLGTANKSNSFAFQDAVNRRIILWNEPNYESSMTDYLKTLFEGGDTKVRVKMLGDTHIKRTPIIILTNNIVNFMADPAFKDRIVQHRWVTAPILAKHKYKPFPLVFFDILLKYEIKF